MAWKILTSLTAVCLAAIATFSYLNLKELNAERQLLEFANTNRAGTIERKQAGEAKLAETKQQIRETQEELEARRGDLADTNRRNSDTEADIARLNSQLQQQQARLARLEEQIREIGSVDELIATATGLESQIEEAVATVANRQQQLAIATNKLADLTSTIQNYQELEGRQRSSRLTDDFQARIASVVPTWGFVILDRGNLGGVLSTAMLDVKRGGETVGQLRIGNVEQTVAFADVIPGSFADGDMPMAGDLVVPSQTSAASAAPGAADAMGMGLGEAPAAPQPVNGENGGMIEEFGEIEDEIEIDPGAFGEMLDDAFGGEDAADGMDADPFQ